MKLSLPRNLITEFLLAGYEFSRFHGIVSTIRSVTMAKINYDIKSIS